MTLDIDQFIPIGVYQVKLFLKDDNAFQPTQTDYKVTIIVNQRDPSDQKFAQAGGSDNQIGQVES